MCGGCAPVQKQVGRHSNVRSCTGCLRYNELYNTADDQPSAALSVFDDAFGDGMFTDMSFFVLTGQVSVGDTIAAADLPEFKRLLSLCVSLDDCSCDVTLSSGVRKTLQFSFNVGQPIPNPFYEGLPIDCIFPPDIGDKHEPRLQRICAHDHVLVVFSSIGANAKPKFCLFPGSSVNLQLCRLTPALCQTNPTAACCWSELQVCSTCCIVLNILVCVFNCCATLMSEQDQFSVVMGHEFEMYEITALTLMRNDFRAASFTANVKQLEERASKLPSTPHWCKTPRDVVRLFRP
jgi:hypothetical protein